MAKGAVAIIIATAKRGEVKSTVIARYMARPRPVRLKKMSGGSLLAMT